ncbi:hypothetical protein MFU01_10740 [Myxococcus fulvus]|uniref:Uncharacterized protein n=1 Tax=Myxococcus fulvus TaxID=33 RepID=A0A511SWX1_MYXFU|nr:hypothetical protein MFU01_10740 [Myxococcus fulvus]
MGRKTIVEPEAQDETLAQWRGGDVVVWMYHASHRRMALRLSAPGLMEELYVVVVGCRFIQGPFSWRASDLRILVGEVRDSGGLTTGRVVFDPSVGFRLECRDVALATGSIGDHDENFNGFLGEQDESP